MQNEQSHKQPLGASVAKVFFSQWGEQPLAFTEHNLEDLALQPMSGALLSASKRSSKLAKKVLSHVFSRPDGGECDYSIFTSRFGELALIERNNEDNANHEELSPSSFAYSVHNAISCLYSIVGQSKRNATSLSVSSKLISSALYEAYGYLACHDECQSVLVVVYDGFLPARYLSQCGDSPLDFTLSFRVERQAGAFELSKQLADLSAGQSFDQELALLQHLQRCDMAS